MAIGSPARGAGRAELWVKGAAALLGVGAALIPAASVGAAPPRAPAAASAGLRPVVLGEVTSAAASTQLSNVTDLLRHDAEAELGAIDWSQAKLRRRYTVSVALVRLSSAATGERSVVASCAVSAAIRDTERGTVLAIVEGSARAEDAPTAALAAERDALAAAVRGAITALPEALRRSQ